MQIHALAYWKAAQRVRAAGQGKDKQKALRLFLGLCCLLSQMNLNDGIDE